MQTSIERFNEIDIRVGTILSAEIFAKAKKPAYKLLIDFGEETGVKKSSAQLTDLYTAEELKGKQVLGVVNFPPRQIADFMSECLVLGLVGDTNGVILLQPERHVKNGLRVG